MNKEIPSSALTAIGSAVVASVVVSWTLTTFTLTRIDRELDQIHRHIHGTVDYMMAPAPAEEEPLELPEEPDYE